MFNQITAVYGDISIDKLSIDQAIMMAHANDPWLESSQFTQSKLQATAVAAGQLNDPTVSLGLANIGADHFDFNQEPMTQFKVGLTQMFPRGKTRAIKAEQLNLLANEHPLLRANRRALLTKQTSLYWLDAYKAQKSIELIEQDRPLFEQLIDLVEASYASGFGPTRQQDLIRAQLELTRLDDRLTVLSQTYEKSIEHLQGLISESQNSLSFSSNEIPYKLSNELPTIAQFNVIDLNKIELVNALLNHPAVKAMEVRIEAEAKGIDLAKQKYKPAWGLSASYGYRDKTNNGNNRADLFSFGVSFQLPIFTKYRQDQELKAAVYSVDSKESQKSLLLRNFIAMLEANKSQLIRLNERNNLYKSTLLPQMKQQAEASLNTYTHDGGDFAEVIRARIAELNAQIDALAIKVDIAKANVEINYFLMGSDNTGTSNQISMEKKDES